jgi:flavodoxin/Pyruvate/2-oxoacid:ferredoxin oxidoreductase delta subunit
MKCGIIYFSATGNTDYVAKLFKKELEKNSISCDLLECSRSKPEFEKYDMFVLGGPIHCEVFPDYYEDYILKHLRIGKGRKLIIFGTQVAEHSPGPKKLGNKLKKLGFKVIIEGIIRMPNNYFVVGFGKTNEVKRARFIEEASKRVEDLVECFLKNKRCFVKVGSLNKAVAKGSYKLFKIYSYGWAKRRLSIDKNLCIKCGRCEKECPTVNISLNNEKTFKASCISCQRCMHNCPVNAFTYKGKHFEQYKKVL